MTFEEYMAMTPEELQRRRSEWTQLWINDKITFGQYYQIYDRAFGTKIAPTPATLGYEYGPFTQWLSKFGLGATGGGPAGAYMRSLYNPARELWQQEQIYAPLLGTQPSEWGPYLGASYTGEPGKMYAQAGQTLRGLMGATPEQREAMGMTWGATFPEEGMGTPEREIPQTAQQSLLGLAMRGAWGPVGASRFKTRLPVEEDIWLQQRAKGEPKSFLDWLRDKYSLGKYF